MSDDRPCPCNSGELYIDCCKPLLDGIQSAATAEALMRSRYTAYAVGDAEYVLKTWHPSRRPSSLSADAFPGWVGLSVLRTEAGGEEDDRGVVEFIAVALMPGKVRKFREVSRFVRENGQWLYMDGDVVESQPAVSSENSAESSKVGRNMPCPCGSGKKYKKCCGS